MSPVELQKLALSQVVYKDLPQEGDPNADGAPWTIEALIKADFIEGAS